VCLDSRYRKVKKSFMKLTPRRYRVEEIKGTIKAETGTTRTFLVPLL
jgi:hypothetical protein